MAYDLHKKSETLDIDAVVGFGDAFLAAMTLFAKRARTGLVVYAVVVSLTCLAIWFFGAQWLLWVLAPLVVGALLAVGFVARITQMDFRRRGGEPLRLHYHVCPSGLEATVGKHNGWMSWDDLWDSTETRSSFLLSPSPEEQYVLPKRYFDQDGIELLRGILADARGSKLS